MHMAPLHATIENFCSFHYRLKMINSCMQHVIAQ